MTLQQYKKKHGLTYDDLVKLTGRNRSDLHKVIQEGATAQVKGSKLVAIDRPPRRWWEIKSDL